jgi:hypothetical protein
MCPISPTGITSIPTQQRSLIKRCSGLHGVQMAVPWDCQQYVVCCSGVPLTYTCHAPMKQATLDYAVSTTKHPSPGSYNVI